MELVEADDHRVVSVPICKDFPLLSYELAELDLRRSLERDEDSGSLRYSGNLAESKPGKFISPSVYGDFSQSRRLALSRGVGLPEAEVAMLMARGAGIAESCESVRAAWKPRWPTEDPRLCWTLSDDVDISSLLEFNPGEMELEIDGASPSHADNRMPPGSPVVLSSSSGTGRSDGVSASSSSSRRQDVFSQSKSQLASASWSKAKSMSSSQVGSLKTSVRELTVATDFDDRLDTKEPATEPATEPAAELARIDEGGIGNS
jgi:hypothetical protein